MKNKMKKTKIEFDANELLRRMKGFAAGREPARERAVKLPPPVKAIPAQQIRAIRLGLGCTQTDESLRLVHRRDGSAPPPATGHAERSRKTTGCRRPRSLFTVPT